MTLADWADLIVMILGVVVVLGCYSWATDKVIDWIKKA